MNEGNSGEALRSLLQELFPFGSTDSYLERIDTALLADGQLSLLAYRSTINYLVRRLISTAVMLERRALAANAPESVLEQEVRRFINVELNLPRIGFKTEQIVGLLMECLRVRSENLPAAAGTRSRHGQSGLCYICGRTLDFVTAGLTESAELEHIFPREMGGSSKWERNLAYACHKCNQTKQSYIDDSDFHYEEMCLSVEEDSESFDCAFQYVYKVAAWTKANFRCEICGTEASRVGELSLLRRNENDGWHLLNMAAYCPSHALRLRHRRTR